MSNHITSFSCGRCPVNGVWYTDFTTTVTRIYFVHSGWAKIYNGFKEYTLKPGYMYLFPQCNDIQTIDSENFDHTFFHFMGSYIIDSNTFLEIKIEDGFYKSFLECTDSIIKERDKYQDVLRSMLKALLEYIVKNEKLSFHNDFIQKSVEIIHADPNYATTENVAEKLSITKHHFIRVFKKTVGTTPMKYIRSCRLANAVVLLKNGASVNEVSALCGYVSPAAFSTAFKREYNLSPSDYAKTAEKYEPSQEKL